MMNSIDLHEIIKQSKLNFGFEWKFIQTGTGGKFNRNQKVIFVETNTIDASGMKTFLTSFFKKNNPIFGVNLSFQPLSRYGTNAQMNQIKQYAPIQSKLILPCLILMLKSAILPLTSMGVARLKNSGFFPLDFR